MTAVQVVRALFQPWRERKTWWRVVHLVVGLFVGIAYFVPTVILLALSLGFLVMFPLALPLIWFLFIDGRLVGRLERSRFAALLDVEMLDPVPPLRTRNPWSRLWERVRSARRWKEIGYALLRLPLGVLFFALTVVAWSGSLALIFLPLYIDGLPENTAHFGLFSVQDTGYALMFSLVGILGVAVIAPWLTVGLSELDVLVARALLSRSRHEELDQKVTQLETSRLAAVDSAEEERRRIERDLHDGAQQRLVALAMNLGAARERLEGDPEGGQELVAQAHEEAKAALKDLRDLVRGFHPVILEDRGLDAALSAVVARSPVPVELKVDMTTRPSPVVESTAYFVVAEALTNVARHSQATKATVSIVRAGGKLVVEVRDDGVGGADASRGTGLTGLRNRVSAVGGRLDVVSPVGGPTTLMVEIPCGS